MCVDYVYQTFIVGNFCSALNSYSFLKKFIL
nr:MAG TPA: hypothetical protein [Caudoviricetes sp.]